MNEEIYQQALKKGIKYKKEIIKKNLEEAQNKGWWIACFYWEKQLKEFE